MKQASKPHPSGPPHNPGVRELIAGKRRHTAPQVQQQAEARRGFSGWHERGYLPHRDAPGLVQFVTFRLADSYPATLRSEWAALLRLEDSLERRQQLETYLDKGHGSCQLGNQEVAALVNNAFRFYHGRNCEMRAWVVMPNHVHALFQITSVPLSKLVHRLKTYTSREANRRLQRKGPFWAEDFWDTYMRNPDHEQQTRHYIENNPVKAGMVQIAKDWVWSSARFRDENGKLAL